jgi:amidase
MNSILDRDTLGAFCRHTHATAKGAATGPLAGTTFAAKDIYDIAGHKTGFGSPDWLATHEPARATAPAVQRLLDAGAALIGKTHTDEMAYSLNGENPHYGTPLNPKAPERIPGGSSNGSVAAVAGGLCDFALGSDTGGSVRAPSSFCGVYGIRPTHGRISLEGVCPLASSFDTVGWFARDAALLERVGNVLLGGAAALPGRLLVATDAFDLAGPAITAALEPGLSSLSDMLGAASRVIVAPEGLPQWFQVFRLLQGAEIWTQHGEWVERTRPRFGPGVRERMAWASKIDANAVAPMREHREAIAKRMAELLDGRAVLALPTVPGIAPLKGRPPAESDDFRARAMSLLSIAGLARLPQVNLPLAELDGCPLGLSLIAACGADEMLLKLARGLAAHGQK